MKIKNKLKYFFHNTVYRITGKPFFAFKRLKYLIDARNEEKVYAFIEYLQKKDSFDANLLYLTASMLHNFGNDTQAITILEKYIDTKNLSLKLQNNYNFSDDFSNQLLLLRLYIYREYVKNNLQAASELYTDYVNTKLPKLLQNINSIIHTKQENTIITDNQKRQNKLINKLQSLIIQGKKIAIVGNSPSLKDSKLGNLIDTYDYIIRVNNYNIVGYEQNVGTRVDLWATAASRSYKGLIRDVEPQETLCVIGKNKQENKMLYAIEVAKTRLNMPENNFIMLDFFQQISLELYAMHVQPSTGFRTIIWLSQVIQCSISTFGFDFFQSSNHHYYDNPSDIKDKFTQNGMWYEIHDFKWENALTNILEYQNKLMRYK